MLDSFFDEKEYELDDLTQVYERQVIISYMDYLMKKKIPFSFSIMDIDNFKYVNDTYGHLVGDDALRVSSKKIENLCKEFGVVGRYGGDEFIFVFPNVQEYEDVWQCGFKVIKSTKDLIIPSCKELSLTYTMGFARYPLDTDNMDELITLADKALYRGKIKGRNCFIIYLPEKHKDIDVMNKRDKVYTPLYLTNNMYNILSEGNNLDNTLNEVLTFMGSTLMIDHICLEFEDSLKYDYYHPLSKKFEGYEPYGYDIIMEVLNSSGFYHENVTEPLYTSDKYKIYKKFKEQGIYSIFISELKAFGKHIGFLRAEMTSVNTGRIWQQSDLVLLSNLSHLISLLIEYKKK